MTVEPSWPRTPSGSGRCPARSQATRAVMMTAAMTRFAVTTRRARRDSAMTAGTVARSSRMMTASAVSRARSEPARPIATPVCGGGQGGGVVDAVADQQDAPARRAWSSLHGGDLVLRQQARAHVADADLGGQAGGGALVVAGQQDRSGAGHRGDPGDGGRGGGPDAGRRCRAARPRRRRCATTAAVWPPSSSSATLRCGRRPASGAEQVRRAADLDAVPVDAGR